MGELGQARRVPGFPGYRISREGVLYTNIPKNGKRGQKTPWRIKAIHKDRDGYWCAWLRKENRSHKRFVHTLVLEAFVGSRPGPKSQCRHLNGVRTDNRLTNLKWGTAKENARDKVRHGTCVGESNPAAKLTEATVLTLRKMREEGVPLDELVEVSGVSRYATWAASTGRTWSHLN